MARYQKVHDPDQTERRFNLVVPRDQCPGFLEFVDNLPMRWESAVLRGILYQFFESHRQIGDLDDAVRSAAERGRADPRKGITYVLAEGPDRAKERSGPHSVPLHPSATSIPAAETPAAPEQQAEPAAVTSSQPAEIGNQQSLAESLTAPADDKAVAEAREQLHNLFP